MILTKGIHHDVTDLHGLLHLVVIAIHSVIDQNTHDLNVVTNVETLKMFYFNHQSHSMFYPS